MSEINIDVDPKLIQEAYAVGRKRGTYLSLGYFISPDGKTVFCQNPNSGEGVFVGAASGFGNLPSDYLNFDMSEEI